MVKAAPSPLPPTAPKPTQVAPTQPKAPRVRVRKQASHEAKVPIVLKQEPTPWWPEHIDVPMVVEEVEKRFVGMCTPGWSAWCCLVFMALTICSPDPHLGSHSRTLSR